MRHLRASHPRHGIISYDHVMGFRVKQGKSFFRTPRRLDSETEIGQEPLHCDAKFITVINQKDGFGGR